MKFLQRPLILNFVLLLLLPLGLFAQKTLRGEVTDASTGEPLIFANIIIKGTTSGANTDVDGSFELRTQGDLPVTLVISYTGFATQEIVVTTDKDRIKIKLDPNDIVIASVEVTGRRISEKQQQSPLTMESLDNIGIRETPAANFYDGLGSLKDVDLTAASLGFKIINMRGFNSTSPVRSLQIIDGVDNQSPGLNFSLGNFLGASELDVNRVNLVIGASSAFYGPNAFNGVISMETKNPFLHQGLSVSVKGGERALLDVGLRWAKALKNKNGQEAFAYKINFSFMRANDWEAENYDPVYNTTTGKDNPGRYDAVNVYGDEYFTLNDLSTAPPWAFPGLGIWHRTGYQEIDLVNYNTRNFKGNAALHFRTKPSKGVESPELILTSTLGGGTTVYQGDNRFSLRDILFFQHRIEFRKTDKFFLRAYATHEDAGNSFDPYFTALLLQEKAKDSELWSQDYSDYWRSNVSPRINELGFPQIDFSTFPPKFDFNAANSWYEKYNDSLFVWHTETETAANKRSLVVPTSTDFLKPGTPAFQQAFDAITNNASRNKREGTRFYDRSALFHIHGEYKFEPRWAKTITVGGNVRMYRPNSNGTIFSDTTNNRIKNNEFGLYAGIDREFFDRKLKASATLRIDKNQNFNLISTPAASLVWNPSPNNYLRASFSSALRNPTLSDQYLFLNVGRAILAGNLNGVDSLITLESFDDFRSTLQRDTLRYFNIDPVQPERVKTFELGYRTTLWNKLFVDAGYYYSIYNDFLGFNIGLKAEFADDNSGLDLPRNVQAFRYAANSVNQVTTQGFSIGLSYYFANYFQINGNYSFNKLNSDIDDPIIPAFNTPKHKYNLGISGRDVSLGNIRNVGFSVNYKWQEGFLFEGSPQFTGLVPSYDLLDAQINWKAMKINTTFKLGASNLLDNQVFQTYGGPRIGRLAYFSMLFEPKVK